MVTEDGRRRTLTSVVVERYLRAEKAKIKPKNSIKAKQKSSMPNSPKKAKKVPKCQTKNFKAKSNQKRPNLTYLALRNAKWQTCSSYRIGSPNVSVRGRSLKRVIHAVHFSGVRTAVAVDSDPHFFLRRGSNRLVIL